MLPTTIRYDIEAALVLFFFLFAYAFGELDGVPKDDVNQDDFVQTGQESKELKRRLAPSSTRKEFRPQPPISSNKEHQTPMVLQASHKMDEYALSTLPETQVDNLTGRIHRSEDDLTSVDTNPECAGTLPTELLLRVFSLAYSCHGIKGLARLSRCSKTFQLLVEPLLYRHVRAILNKTRDATRYKALATRMAPTVRSLTIYIDLDNLRKPDFTTIPVEKLVNLRHLQLIFASEVPKEDLIYGRLGNLLTQIPPSTLQTLCLHFNDERPFVLGLVYGSLSKQNGIQQVQINRIFSEDEKETDGNQAVQVRAVGKSSFPLFSYKGMANLCPRNLEITHFFFDGRLTLDYVLHQHPQLEGNQVDTFCLRNINRKARPEHFRELAWRHPEIKSLGTFVCEIDNRGKLLVSLLILMNFTCDLHCFPY